MRTAITASRFYKSLVRRWKVCVPVVLGAAFLSAQPELRAQLAITEVMASASPNPDGGDPYPDFWELSNFGSNAVPLTGYLFTDNSSFEKARPNAFVGLEIKPGESIIFARRDPLYFRNAAQFREWWGSALATDTQIVMYDPAVYLGFNQTKDSVQLWDSQSNLVDVVTWDASNNAQPNYTMTYSPVTGEFPISSEAGRCHAFVAAASGLDVGSPGTNCGSIPLQFSLEPTNTVADGGTSVKLSSSAYGFPHPRFQWYFNGEVISHETNKSLSLANVTPLQAGRYYVVITNGLNFETSRVAELTVNTNERPCELISSFSDLTVTVGEEPTFSIVTRGYPLCQYQWYLDGSAIAGQTSSTLQFAPVNFTDTGDYTVIASNKFTTCTASARLTVTRKPKLYVTEIMAWPSGGHEDWWELTNYDSNAVDVAGYRFDDADGSFGGAFTITNSLILVPGESMILVERMTAAEFRGWWGWENLPPGLKIVTWFGFSFNANADMLALWNATTSGRFDCIDSISFAWALPDTTFACPTNRPVDLETNLSVIGQGGAFCAAHGGDIGSPGYTTNPPPRITAIQRVGSDAVIRWRAPAGTACRLEARDTLAPGPWTSIGSFAADCTIMTVTNSATGRQQFYRLAPGP